MLLKKQCRRKKLKLTWVNLTNLTLTIWDWDKENNLVKKKSKLNKKILKKKLELTKVNLTNSHLEKPYGKTSGKITKNKSK